MINETQRNCLEQLGEELLQEFDEARNTPISFEFDRNARKLIEKKQKSSVSHAVFWVARAAVFAFALVGVLTVAALSIDSWRTPLFKFAAAQVAPLQATYPEEEPLEFQQISHATTDNATLAVYCDGNDRYQLLWADEFGQRWYYFQSSNMDAASILSLCQQFASNEEWEFEY